LAAAAEGGNDTTSTAQVHSSKLVQLTRLNIPIEDTNVAQETMNNAAILSSYDVLAVQPQSERAFAFACNSLDIDIISLDLSKRLNYRFRPDLIKTALQRGVYFEILYAPLLREPGSRRQMFANAQSLARETRGRGIILSSAARTAIELRGPYDVVNLATFLGMSEAQAHAAVGKNPAAVVEHAKKRKAFRGTLVIRVSCLYL
jgi:ribonuclease P/MRP protein subunit RPP1